VDKERRFVAFLSNSDKKAPITPLSRFRRLADAARIGRRRRCACVRQGYTRRGTFFRTEPRVERWASARLFLGPERDTFGEIRMMDRELEQIQNTVEGRLHDLLALDRPASERLRLVIDRPGGVDIALCERVTGMLRDLLEAYSLEVSSPGPERPLTKPEHFRRYLGRRVRVRTREDVEGHKSFTGRLTGADDESVSVDSGDGPVAIPLAAVRRSNLLSDGATNGGVGA
jgi:ribosome maturation factor RimP